MTLLELVIAMALVSIVLAGAGVTLFAMQKTANRETKNHVTLLEAKTLSQAIDYVVKARAKNDVILFNHVDNLGKEEIGVLFTVEHHDSSVEEYGFDGKKFGIVVSNKIEGDKIVYSSSYPMFINCRQEAVFDEIIICYGENFSMSLTLIEKV